MDNNLFDQLVLSIKEAGAIKSGEVQANRIKNLRLLYFQVTATPGKNRINFNGVFAYSHCDKKT